MLIYITLYIYFVIDTLINDNIFIYQQSSAISPSNIIAMWYSKWYSDDSHIKGDWWKKYKLNLKNNVRMCLCILCIV